MSNDRHPWLDGSLADVDSLSDVERVLTFLAGNAARGDLAAVRRDWAFVDASWHRAGLEVILQTHLFAGYPRAINALAAVREVGVSPGAAEGAEETREQWLAAGEALCQSVYGDVYEPLRARIAQLHPALDTWMVEIGYGRVLSRPGAAPRLRELCVLAVLAGQDVPRQLRSHLQGALHVGATMAECRAVLDQTARVWGEVAQAQVDAVWARFAGNEEGESAAPRAVQ